MSQSIFAYIVAAILLIVSLIFLARPIKALLKIIVNSAFGGIFLMLFNFIGGLMGLYIGVNAATAVTLGILGIPGFVMILVLQTILK